MLNSLTPSEVVGPRCFPRFKTGNSIFHLPNLMFFWTFWGFPLPRFSVSNINSNQLQVTCDLLWLLRDLPRMCTNVFINSVAQLWKSQQHEGKVQSKEIVWYFCKMLHKMLHKMLCSCKPHLHYKLLQKLSCLNILVLSEAEYRG